MSINNVNQQEFNPFGSYPDFPKPGVTFEDISPLLANPNWFNRCIDEMEKQVAKYGIDAIAALDSRGFIFGSALAIRMQRPLVMIRKAGKLPGETEKFTTDIEYGTVNLEVQKTEVLRDRAVLIVDDLLATGGTAYAAKVLVESQGGDVVCFLFAIDLELDGSRDKLNGIPVEVTKPRLIKSIQDAAFAPKVVRYDQQNSLMNIILYHPSQESMALELAKKYRYCQTLEIQWNAFKDGCPNVSFPGMDCIARCRVIYLGNLYRLDQFLVQQSLLIALCRQNIESLDILWPYFTTATMERVNHEGELAVAEPLAKMMSLLPRLCKVTMSIFDIHALPERFYFQDPVTMILHTGVKKMIELAELRWNGNVIYTFPDDGAYKRFGSFIPTKARVMVCNKTRDGDIRKIIITGKYGFNTDPSETNEYRDVLIIDDLVQSGGTLNECALALKSAGVQRISAYCTHAVFPDASYRHFMAGKKYDGLDTFYVTDTIPQRSEVLQEVKPFKVISVIDEFASGLDLEERITHFPLCLGSKSLIKKNALIHALKENHMIQTVDSKNVNSGVSEQPLSVQETKKGAKNRAIGALQDFDRHYGIGIESGMILERKKEIVVVCIVDKTGGCEFTELRTPVPFTDKFVKDRQREETFGQFLVRYGLCGADGNEKDWQTEVLGFSRTWMLAEVLNKALKNTKFVQRVFLPLREE